MKTLEEKVRERVENAIWKRDGKALEVPRDAYAVQQDVNETIDNWSMSELLSAISLELEVEDEA